MVLFFTVLFKLKYASPVRQIPVRHFQVQHIQVRQSLRILRSRNTSHCNTVQSFVCNINDYILFLSQANPLW